MFGSTFKNVSRTCPNADDGPGNCSQGLPNACARAGLKRTSKAKPKRPGIQGLCSLPKVHEPRPSILTLTCLNKVLGACLDGWECILVCHSDGCTKDGTLLLTLQKMKKEGSKGNKQSYYF